MSQDITKFGSMTIFHFESPRASDLGHAGRREADLVEAACRLSGHRFHSFGCLNKRQLKDQLRYIFDWEIPKKAENKPQFSLHFSTHGNGDGVQVGATFLTWTDLAVLINEASAEASFPYMAVFSSCGQGRPPLDGAFSALKNPPCYVFTFAEETTWEEAAHVSSLIYRLLPGVAVSERDKVKEIVRKINGLGTGSSLLYFRWDSAQARYRHFRGA